MLLYSDASVYSRDMTEKFRRDFCLGLVEQEHELDRKRNLLTKRGPLTQFLELLDSLLVSPSSVELAEIIDLGKASAEVEVAR